MVTCAALAPHASRPPPRGDRQMPTARRRLRVEDALAGALDARAHALSGIAPQTSRPGRCAREHAAPARASISKVTKTGSTTKFTKDTKDRTCDLCG